MAKTEKKPVDKTIQERAAEVFDRNKGTNLLYFCDGHFWLPGSRSLAYDHARKCDQDVVEVKRPKTAKAEETTQE